MHDIPVKASIWLVCAIASEIVATSSLKASNGFTHPLFSAIVVVGYGFAFYLLSRSMEYFSIGTVYAIWSGLGTIGVVAVGVLIWNEPIHMTRVIGVVLIIVGVVILQLFSSPTSV